MKFIVIIVTEKKMLFLLQKMCVCVVRVLGPAQTHQSGMSVLPIMEAKLVTGLRATHTL